MSNIDKLTTSTPGEEEEFNLKSRQQEQAKEGNCNGFTPDIFGYIDNMQQLVNSVSTKSDGSIRMMTSFALKTATEFSKGCQRQVSASTVNNHMRIKELEEALFKQSVCINLLLGLMVEKDAEFKGCKI